MQAAEDNVIASMEYALGTDHFQLGTEFTAVSPLVE